VSYRQNSQILLNKRTRAVAIATVSLIIFAGLLTPAVSAETAVDPVDAAFESAIRLHQSGDREGAVRAYEAILVNSPTRADVRSKLAAAYSALGRYEDAIRQYKQALVMAPENLTIRFNLSM